MGIGIGNLGSIVDDFTESVKQIFGAAGSKNAGKGGSSADLFKLAYGGNVQLSPEKWLGNSQGTQKYRYGFSIVELNADGTLKTDPKHTYPEYFLDIPPQSIRQKEIFATNITATRKGIIVESEGVVFKDITLQGTTGIFPGKRGSSEVPISNLFSSPFDPPGEPGGVDVKTGQSTASNVKTISGYEEFMRLRQYFLQYAYEKVKADGNLFLIFINEKDDQNLIVEPLEFEMERNAKAPMQYQYRIALKAIGNINNIFKNVGQAAGPLSILEQIGNLSANVSASIGQARAVIDQSRTLLTRITQAIDTTFLNPLRQTQAAMSSLADGTTTVLSLPQILVNNVKSSVLDIAESANSISNSVSNFSVSTTSDQETRLAQTAAYQQQQAVITALQTNSKVPLPRSFVERTQQSTKDVSYSLADFTNLGDPTFDALKGRTPTIQSSSLKIVSDDEFLLMGALQEVISQLGQSLASNGMFAADAEVAFQNTSKLFNNPTLPTADQIIISQPANVREVTIQGNDILERIAQREYGDASRWLDLVVLNNLKPPYIDPAGGDGVKKPGEKLLIGDN